MADKKFSDLPAASGANLNDLLAKSNSGGAPSQGLLVSQLKTLFDTIYQAVGSYVTTARNVSTTAPVTGGGDLSADRTIAVSDFVASGGAHARGSVPDPGAVAGTAKFLCENANWVAPTGAILDFTPTNSTGQGMTMAMTLGESMSFGDVVYFKSDGKVWKADATTIATAPVMGMMIGVAGVANDSRQILLRGVAKTTAWGYANGNLIYLNVGGGITITKPSTTDQVVQSLGVMIASNVMLFNPSPDYITIV